MKAKVTDFPYKGKGTKTGLKDSGSKAPHRSGNLRAADAHVSSVRAAAGTKKAPTLNGGGTLHDVPGGTPRPIAHLGNGGQSKGQNSREAEFRDAAVAK